MSLLKTDQHSHEWFEARLGSCTASRVKDALATLSRASQGRVKGDASKAREKYLMEVVLGRLTGIVPEHCVTYPMQWGIENEEHACRAYQVVTGNDLLQIGLAKHDRIDRFMASADRYVNDVGLLEVKCPTSPVHLDYRQDGVIPPEYRYQVMAQLACDDTREWADFVSFDPRFPPNLQVFIAPRMYREEWKFEIAKMEDGVRKFLADVAQRVEEMKVLPGYESMEQTRSAPPKDDGTYINDDDIAWIMQKHEEQRRTQ